MNQIRQPLVISFNWNDRLYRCDFQNHHILLLFLLYMFDKRKSPTKVRWLKEKSSRVHFTLLLFLLYAFDKTKSPTKVRWWKEKTSEFTLHCCLFCYIRSTKRKVEQKSAGWKKSPIEFILHCCFFCYIRSTKRKVQQKSADWKKSPIEFILHCCFSCYSDSPSNWQKTCKIPRFSVGREAAEAERSGVEAKTRDGPARLSLSGFGDKRDARVRVLRTPLIS